MKVEQGKKIKIEYELALEDGTVLETSADRGPLEYVHGDGRMLPGFETRIEGMQVDDERAGVIPAEEAAGSTEALTSVISRQEFPEGEAIEVGKQFTANSAEGPVTFEVVAIDGDQVTVRFVHPLAGKSIKFQVKVLEISD